MPGSSSSSALTHSATSPAVSSSIRMFSDCTRQRSDVSSANVCDNEASRRVSNKIGQPTPLQRIRVSQASEGMPL